MSKSKIIKGRTPNGGAYAEIVFFDADGNTTTESKSVRCVIRECSSDGKLIAETWSTPKR